MNLMFILLTSLFFSISLSADSHSKNTPQIAEHSYFGEEPPGLIPKVFEPKIVSPEGNFEEGTFTPDMKEFYFTRANGKYKKRAFLSFDTKIIGGDRNLRQI